VLVYGEDTPPCQFNCPINTDVQGYLSLITQGKFEEALALNREVNPFPLICGRVCTHPCEAECIRAQYDEPVAICALKRFVGDYELRTERHQAQTPIAKTRSERVAIIGAGPAGLTAAHDLVKLGYPVTVFDSLEVAGGMLYWGIPEYRLPKKLLQLEIDDLKSLGVEIRTGVSVGENLTIDDLFQQGYKAVLIAIGAHKGLKGEVPGEDESEGAIDCLRFLRAVNSGHRDRPGDKVVVIGGGNAAIDSARSALRLGSKEVNIIYRRSSHEMPAIPSEVEEAEREGIKIHFQVAPVRIVGEKGSVKRVECVRTKLAGPDASGRRQPIPVKGSHFQMDADAIILAIGHQPDTGSLGGNNGIGVSEQGTLVVDYETLSTTKAGVFAAGDAVSGPATIIDAMASGRKAAISIDGYISGKRLPEQPTLKTVAKSSSRDKILGEVPKRPRRNMTTLPFEERISSFNEINLGFTEKDAKEEAKRCLGCSIFSTVDIDSCCGITCRLCMDSCWKDAITLTEE